MTIDKKNPADAGKGLRLMALAERYLKKEKEPNPSLQTTPIPPA